jgi:16S rRNA G966 N2-methylase RsmD
MLDELISKTTQKNVQDFIFSHENEDERKLVLTKKKVLELPSTWIAQQIAGRRRAKFKLTTWYETKGIIYPPTLNLEQTSSEATAKYKTTLIQQGKIGVDLTGGFGIDSFYLSTFFKRFVFVEPDKDLLDLAKHNHVLLGATNIDYVNSTAEEFIKHAEKFDFIYGDPSRRSHQQKVFKLADCTPNIIDLLPALFEKSQTVLIKTSPLLDLQQGVRALKNVDEIHVVAVDNECKELLFLLRKQATTSPVINTVDLDSKRGIKQKFSFHIEEEKKAEAKFSAPLAWLYEPNAAILKAGAFKIITSRYPFFKLHPSSHIYTSNEMLETFPGRTFKVVQHLKLDKTVKKFFPNGQANILTRNFPLSVEEIKKKTGLKEGGELYLICTQSESQKHVLMSERVFLFLK